MSRFHFCIGFRFHCRRAAFTRGASTHAAAFKVTRLTVQPAAIELRGDGAEHGLLVTAWSADGRQTDVTAQARFTSRQPNFVNVSTNGNCRALADGSGEVLVEFGRKTATVVVTARETAAIRAPPRFGRTSNPC